MPEAAKVAEALNATLVDMRFVKPLDDTLILEMAAQHDALVTLEENAIMGGAGSGVNEVLMAHRKPVPVLNIGLPDFFIPQGTQEEARAELGLDAAGIEAKIKGWHNPSLLLLCLKSDGYNRSGVMQYNTLGNTDLRVSRLCLGCMTFGEPSRGNHARTLPEESSRPIIKRALEGGINFDTANSYSDGSSEEISSEEIVGRALRDFARRDEVVVATKVFHRVGDLPEGLSRAQILRSIDDSLTRLGMEYVDILQIHRWDYTTPIEETLEALNDVVKAGKARYIGASSMHASQFAQALALQKQHGWAPFVTMQDHYNLIYREEEREMLPLCWQEGVAVIPWSPLARGRLTRLGRNHGPAGLG